MAGNSTSFAPVCWAIVCCQTGRVMQFAHDDLHALTAHPLLELDDMARRRVHARADFDRADRLHAEALGKIEHVGMVAHELHAAQRRRLTLPTGDGRIKCGEVGARFFLKVSLMLG